MEEGAVSDINSVEAVEVSCSLMPTITKKTQHLINSKRLVVV